MILRFLILLVVISIFSALAYYNFALPAKIEQAIKGQLEQNFNAKATVKGLKFSIFNGELNIKSITVKNPAEFTANNAIVLEGLTIKLEPKSLLHATILIDHIIIKALQVQLEANNHGINLLKFQQYNKQIIEQQSLTQNSNNSDNADQEKMVAIGMLKIESLAIRNDMFSEANASIQIENIVIKDIGTNAGVPMSQLIQLILNTISQKGVKYMKVLDADEKLGAKINKIQQKLLDKLNKTTQN